MIFMIFMWSNDAPGCGPPIRALIAGFGCSGNRLLWTEIRTSAIKIFMTNFNLWLTRSSIIHWYLWLMLVFTKEHWRENLWPKNTKTTNDDRQNQDGLTVAEESTVKRILILYIFLILNLQLSNLNLIMAQTLLFMGTEPWARSTH